MATESDRRTSQNSTSKSQNWNRRIDAGHSHGNVPVLFRLKNLQRVSANEAENGSPPTKFDTDFALQPAEIREPKRAENSVPGPHTLRSDAARKQVAAPIASASKPTTDAKADPVTAPGKHGVSNGVIFLIAIVAIAFSVGRKIGSSGPASPASSTTITANQSAPVSSPAVGSETPAAISQASSALMPEPLVVPTLPQLANDSTSASNKSSDESSTDNAPKFSTFKSENGLLTLDMDLSSSKKGESVKSEDDSMSVPLTLASDSVDPKTSEETSTAKSLGTDSATATNPKPSATSAIKPSSEPTSSAAPDSFLLSTNTPHTDLENMFQIRANYQNGIIAQSEAAALAKTRQSPPDAGFQQNNVAGYQPVYGTQNTPAFNQVPVYNQPGMPTGTVPAQPVGYGGQSRSPIQTPTYGNPSIPNAAGMATKPYVGPTATMPSYPQSQNQLVPQGQTTGNSPYAQPMNQPYVPLFKPADAPPMNPGGFAVPPASTPYVPIGNQFNPEGYPN